MTTIDEVAHRSGVGRGTVSRVINEDPRVSPETRSRVLTVIQELDYHPSASARRMVRKSVDTIGIATFGKFRRPWEEQLWLAPVLGGINDVAVEYSWHTLWFGALYTNPPRSTAPLYESRCDGILFFSVPEHDSSISKLVRLHIPFVMVSDTAVSPDVSSVDVENLQSAKSLTNYLIESGHRRIAFVAQVADYRWVQDRRAGYFCALTEHGIREVYDVFLQKNYSEPLLMDKVLDLMKLPVEIRPTALFTASDNLALEAANALRSVGLRVPDDISIVSFGNPNANFLKELSLTTMDTPYDQIGRDSAILLMDIIAGRETQGKKITRPLKLSVRDSVKSLL